METSSLIRPLCLLFSFCGLIQGIIWFVLSMLAILASMEILDIPENLDSTLHNDLLLSTIKQTYFVDEYKGMIMDYEKLQIFSAIYIGLCTAWMGVSGKMFYYARFYKWERLKVCLRIYCGVVTLVTIVDLIIMCFFIADYTKMINFYDKSGMSMHKAYVLFVIAIMMTLAARGFVLLLLNIASVIYSSYILFVNIYLEERKNNGSNNERILSSLPIYAYRANPVNNNQFVEAVNEEPFNWTHSEQFNEGFVVEHLEPPMMEPYRMPRNSSTPKPAQENNPPLWFRDFDQKESDSERYDSKKSLYGLPSKINKSTPPIPPPKPKKSQSRKGPPIPFPDYTPPSSPTTLRSVIKPTSSYY